MAGIELVSLFEIVFQKPKNFLSALKYFTTFSILCVLTSRYTCKFLDLFLMTLVVLVLSSWIVFVYPRYISLTDYIGREDDDKEYVLIGWNLIYGHLILHVLPFVAIVALGYRPEKKITWKTWLTVAVLSLYISSSNTTHLYGIDKSQLLVLGLLTIIFFQLLTR